MKTLTMLAAALALAAGAHADDAARPATRASETIPATASSDSGPTPSAADDSQAVLDALAKDIRAQGGRASSKARLAAETAMTAVADKTDEAAAKGETRVAQRLEAEFGVPLAELMDEKSRYAASWGEMIVAHTLAASLGDVTSKQLLTLHHDGMGWALISAGLGLRLNETVSAVRAEGRVATGAEKPDGKVAEIRGHDAHGGPS